MTLTPALKAKMLALLAKQELSQSAIARRCGVSKSVVQRTGAAVRATRSNKAADSEEKRLAKTLERRRAKERAKRLATEPCARAEKGVCSPPWIPKHLGPDGEVLCGVHAALAARAARGRFSVDRQSPSR